MVLVQLSEVATRCSVDDYQALAADPNWADRRVELIRGVILEMSPQSELHERVVTRILEWLYGNVNLAEVEVRASSSLRTADSVPMPDLLVLPRDRHPGLLPDRAALVIEVAVTSVPRDTSVKPEIYAEAASEYWVIQPGSRTALVHRDPAPSGYRSVEIYGGEAQLTPRNFGVTEPLSLDALFAAS